ncbi:cob(I)yrinic acid a,c-diamide adenosyltransferase [Oceanotoga sp. DSM 15011]|jgi:cob(I)alamin adenosyltransferase|uniref:Cob(I)yrinic acid a,c-diamide adenosyltransferase n=1 Tax=Oceanotoga teriensis TaxID=515440 RepID=A0AA45HJW1_9BACT|nr:MULTISPECIES: cob(I)yrinic acid a,c-diamide adenosyltransferase [Oceanotoga]MDN5342942.1 cob(I)alamin adenosyltransferase [Oceanotoga sp.]MDO7975327.1 cob(I)yrinic acid a,c-diamide adenosyltransferase [Oceanotoga teriensis]PWJ96659.1 cob(I)yrinic acid a,c-diamide adenosyltransferase [Oceanotoga teriensis]UYP00170.1 cob(I)yrinic acid a,c-diamide adenosyltransferase [Oceanotoga sp. DSM 15011]
MKNGMIHVYTGNGKGKTTAAFGVVLRSILSNKEVFVAQFVKNRDSSELSISNYFDNIDIVQYGEGFFIRRSPETKDINAAKKALADVKEKIISQKYDLIVMDEINIAIKFNLLTAEEVLDAINSNGKTEIILTGRWADEKIIERADLVTEMKEIKHYYSKGVLSRKGIDK